jgi:hypothetical protein
MAELGPIDVGKTYPLEVFKSLTGQSNWGIRKAFRAGLKSVKVGKRKYVTGKAWAEFLEEQSKAERADFAASR